MVAILAGSSDIAIALYSHATAKKTICLIVKSSITRYHYHRTRSIVADTSGPDVFDYACGERYEQRTGIQKKRLYNRRTS